MISDYSAEIKIAIFQSISEHQGPLGVIVSCTNLVNFHPIISEFMLLKCAIFAAIWPQFNDDFHMSPWHN